MIPAHLVARERKERYGGKRQSPDSRENDREIRKEMYRMWQTEWNEATTRRRRHLKKRRAMGQPEVWMRRLSSNPNALGPWLFWSLFTPKKDNPLCVNCNS